MRGSTVLPIIFITAFPEERIRKRAEAAGAVGFFSKTRRWPRDHRLPR